MVANRRTANAAARNCSSPKEKEKKRLTHLDREVASWHNAQEIRAYVEVVRSLGLKKHGRIDPGSEMDQWTLGRLRRPIGANRWSRARHPCGTN